MPGISAPITPEPLFPTQPTFVPSTRESAHLAQGWNKLEGRSWASLGEDNPQSRVDWEEPVLAGVGEGLPLDSGLKQSDLSAGSLCDDLGKDLVLT